jgi:RNA polymerase sigma factor (sigma-70 family)
MTDAEPIGDPRRGGIAARKGRLGVLRPLPGRLPSAATAATTDCDSLGTTDSTASAGSAAGAGSAASGTSSAERLVNDLYHAHGLALVRTALLLVGDKPTAEDIVQDAFIGLYRAVQRLTSTDKALAYLRASVVNGCRSVHRTRQRSFLRQSQSRREPAVWSAESAAMAREDSRLALQAVSRLPGRAREVLALRYYLDLTDSEIAAALGVSRGTVSSTASRALATLARELKGEL